MGAVGFPYIIPSSALGADGHIAPSERITLGFIGMGKLGHGAHLQAFLRNPATHVLAVSDVESLRLEKSKQSAENYYADTFGKGAF